MLKVHQLLKFVSDLNPQNTPARLAFYNFLKGFASADEDLTPHLIEQFFNYSLDYPHWAANKVQLGHEVQFLLENFNSFYQQKFDLRPIRFPQHTQLVEIEQTQDWTEILNTHLRTHCGPDDKFRLVSDQNKRMIAIVLKEDRSLEVRTFDRKFTIRDGMLEPLRADLCLYYNANLELDSSKTHKIEVAPYITAQFKVSNERVFGSLLRGYVFQKHLEMKGEPLKEQTRLLFPIKRLEQFFVDRRTDPYYQDIVTQLERTQALIAQGDHEALRWSSMILTQAETALENVFVGEKLLGLLVRDLRHSTQNYRPQPAEGPVKAKEECLKITPINEFDLTN